MASSLPPDKKKYKCQFCSRPFSRSEHKTRHERSHTKERPFKCVKCRSTFVRRDLLLRHDRTVHANDNNNNNNNGPAGGSAAATGTGTGNAGRRRGKREKLRKGEKQEDAQQGEGVDDKNNNNINVNNNNNNAQTEDQRASHQPNYDHGHDSIPTPAGSGRPSDVVSTAPTALPSPDRPAITIDPAALSHPARLPMNYNVQPPDVDVDIEAAAMLMTDFQSKAAASVGSAPSASGALPDTPSPGYASVSHTQQDTRTVPSTTQRQSPHLPPGHPSDRRGDNSNVYDSFSLLTARRTQSGDPATSGGGVPESSLSVGGAPPELALQQPGQQPRPPQPHSIPLPRPQSQAHPQNQQTAVPTLPPPSTTFSISSNQPQPAITTISSRPTTPIPSMPIPLSPYSSSYPYATSYPAPLTPGMSLLNPPGPGSSSSLNMTMGSMLNLSPVVGNKRERPSGSLSPGPALPPLNFGGPSSAAPTSVPAGNRGLHESTLLDSDGRDGKNKRRRTRLQPKQAPPSPRIPDNFPRQIPQIQTGEQYAAIVEAVNAVDADDDNLSILPETFSLPSLPLLNAYLSSYFTHYHPHLPFLHIPTFVPHEVQPALLLSILSLGSLFTTDGDVCTRTHDVEASLNLHVAAKILISRFLAHRSDFDSRLCPLWALQSTLLNMIWGSWSGDAKGLEWSCSIKSLLANLVSGGLYTLKRRIEGRKVDAGKGESSVRGERRQFKWDDWVDEEGCRRTYFAVFIFFGLLTLAFNHPNSLSGDELDDLELPCEENLWEAPRHVVETFWDDVRAASGKENSLQRDVTSARGEGKTNSDERTASEAQLYLLLEPPTVRTAHDALFRGERTYNSTFALRVMINVLFYEVWNHRRTIVALQDVVTEFKLRLALDAWENGVQARIGEEITRQLRRPEGTQGGNEMNRNFMRSLPPLLSNALAMYRTARIRLAAVDIRPVQEALRYHSPFEIAASMTVARDSIKRGDGGAGTAARLEDVIKECCEGLEEMFTWTKGAQSNVASERSKKTETSNGQENADKMRGVEYALCGVDIVVILTLWLYRLENAGRGQNISENPPDDAGLAADDAQIEPEPEATETEIALYHRVRNLIAGVDERVVRSAGPAELSAAVSKVWSEILDPESSEPELDSEGYVQSGDQKTTTWGIEKILGESFRLHSQALIGYRDDLCYTSPGVDS